MYDRLLTLFVIGAVVLTCSGDGDGRRHYTNPELTEDVKDKSGDYEFFYHSKNNLLLTVGPNDCYYSTLTADEQGMLKYEPKEAESRIIRTISSNHNIADTDLVTMREQHQDLLANFHCVGRRVHTLDARSAMSSGDDDDDSSSSSSSNSSEDDD